MSGYLIPYRSGGGSEREELTTALIKLGTPPLFLSICMSISTFSLALCFSLSHTFFHTLISRSPTLIVSFSYTLTHSLSAIKLTQKPQVSVQRTTGPKSKEKKPSIDFNKSKKRIAKAGMYLKEVKMIAILLRQISSILCCKCNMTPWTSLVSGGEQRDVIPSSAILKLERDLKCGCSGYRDIYTYTLTPCHTCHHLYRKAHSSACD